MLVQASLCGRHNAIAAMINNNFFISILIIINIQVAKTSLGFAKVVIFYLTIKNKANNDGHMFFLTNFAKK